MDFRKATADDIEEICRLVQHAIAVMEENGIPQWDDVYPTREDFLNDIHSGTLYAGTVDGTISVIFALNKCQDEAYFSANWSYRGERFCVLHRLCVNPQFQNQGVAKKTLIYIEEKLLREGIESIRLDVFTQNPFALRLYEKAGYHQTGTADWRKGKFILMEKVLKGGTALPTEINPETTTRAMAYKLWMKAPNPMVTFFKTLDVTKLVKLSRKKHLKFNMLLDWCIGKAASSIKEFYLLPVGDKLMQYDNLAVNTIVKNKEGEINSCDILFTGNLKDFNREYVHYTAEAASHCTDRDLSETCMVIGTSAIIDTEIDGAVGMNSGIFNNPFIIWGRYKRRFFRYTLTISFQFHHTQMDGAHAGKFLAKLQDEITDLK